MFSIGSLLSAPWFGPVSSLIGTGISAFGRSRSARAANLAAAATNQQNIEFARESAQNRLQWAAEDARKAGLHPLAAIGASSGGGFAIPVRAGGQSPMGDALDALGRGLGSIGGLYTPDDADYSPAERALVDEAVSRSRVFAGLNDRAVERGPGLPPPRDYVRDEKNYLVRRRRLFGQWVYLPPGMDAQDMADEFGDISQEIGGPGQGLWSAANQARLKALYERQQSVLDGSWDRHIGPKRDHYF